VIRWQHIGSHPTGASAQVSNRILLENVTAKGQTFKIHVSLFTLESNTPIASINKEVRVHPGTQALDVYPEILQIRLWGHGDRA
jgi:hypothetical protein